MKASSGVKSCLTLYTFFYPPSYDAHIFRGHLQLFAKQQSRQQLHAFTKIQAVRIRDKATSGRTLDLMAPRIGRGLYCHLRCLPTTQPLAVRSHALVTTTRSFDKVTPTASVKPKPKLIKTKTRLSDMPAMKLGPDGLPQKALEAWDETDISCKRSKSKTIRSSAKTAKAAKAPSDGVTSPVITCSKTEIEYLQDAIQQGVIPDTPLAHEVYLNWKRFPDCILLTRVGKFYEVSLVPYIPLFRVN